MQVEPQQILPLVYQLTDPLDSDTYYVRAIVTDSLTGTVLETKNLSTSGSGRYTSSFNAPVDSTGLGRHIDVVISVYTDSGYTTYSSVYQKKIDKYLVKKQSNFFGGGSGGSEIDYEKISKIVSGIVEENSIEMENKIKDLEKKVDKIESIKAENITSDVISSLDSVDKSISSLKESVNSLPKFKEINLSSIESSLSILSKDLEKILKLATAFPQTTEKLGKEIEKISSDTIKPIENIIKDMQGIADEIDNLGRFVNFRDKMRKAVELLEMEPEVKEFKKTPKIDKIKKYI